MFAGAASLYRRICNSKQGQAAMLLSELKMYWTEPTSPIFCFCFKHSWARVRTCILAVVVGEEGCQMLEHPMSASQTHGNDIAAKQAFLEAGIKGAKRPAWACSLFFFLGTAAFEGGFDFRGKPFRL
eukprot:scaffold34536_cov21-Tisochrysis_lutea.AAC.1